MLEVGTFGAVYFYADLKIGDPQSPRNRAIDILSMVSKRVADILSMVFNRGISCQLVLRKPSGYCLEWLDP